MILFWQGQHLAGDVPSWLCFLAAIGQLTYMILDNADGKQARKTGSSSPLGLLFDHGCDAMNTFISGLTLFTVVQLDINCSPALAYIMPMNAFFFATWEEYYVDGLHLPVINGANEGIVMVIFMFVISGIFGTQIWLKELGPYTLNQYVVIAFIFMSVVTILGNIYNVYKHDRSKIKDSLGKLIIILYIDVTILIVHFLSKSKLADSHSRLLIYFVGFCFAKLVGHLQMAHVSHEEFQQFRRSIIFSCTLLNTYIILNHFTDSNLIAEEKLLMGCVIYSLIVYLHFAFSAIHQFCTVLKIYAFKLGKRDSYETLLDPTQKLELA